MFEDPETALDMLVREELGLDPDELGSPWGAAVGLVRGVRDRRGHPGHPVPVRRRRRRSSWPASALSLVALFVVGAGVSLLTGRGVLFSGFRQLGIGLGAAVVTYVIGSLIGVIGGRMTRSMSDGRRCATDCAARAWTRAPGRTARATATRAHDHGYDKVIVVADGSIDFGLPASGRVDRVWPPATASSCRPARRTTRSSGPTA